MTLDEIRVFLTAVDPGIKHYFSMAEGDAYSYWEETRPLPFCADGGHTGGWRFYVHRFTRNETDTVAEALYAALDASDRIAVRRTVDYERDTGYIHHIFECEGY